MRSNTCVCVRETGTFIQQRPLVIELQESMLRIRLKGARRAYDVDYPNSVRRKLSEGAIG
jgi:hypothetical protein